MTGALALGIARSGRRMKSPTERPGRPPRTNPTMTTNPPTSGAAPLPSAAAAALAALRMGLTGPELEQAVESLAQGTIFGRHAAIGKMICRETEFALAETLLEYRQRHGT